MADQDSPLSQPESNNFENDFEKLDPFAPTGANPDEIVSSSAPTGEEAEEDLYSASPVGGSEPLISLGGESTGSSASGGSSSSVSFMKNIDPRVLDLIYWRDVKKTGVVFGSMMVLLLSLAMFSVLSVVAYLSLAALTVTISFRVYKNILQAVQKTGEGHPFKQFLDVDIAIPSDKVHQAADHIVQHASCTLRELRHLFLVEDLIDSIKFALLLWVLTYIGAWFNGMTLIILATITIFSLPKVYEVYKVQIDQYLDLARAQIRNVMKQIQEKIPLPGKKKTA